MSKVLLVVLNTFDKELKVKVRQFLSEYTSQDIWILSPSQIIQRGIAGFPRTTCLVLGEDYINPKCYSHIKFITQVTESNYTYEVEKAVKRLGITKSQ